MRGAGAVVALAEMHFVVGKKLGAWGRRHDPGCAGQEALSAMEEVACI
jgi:hypothetical protein